MHRFSFVLIVLFNLTIVAHAQNQPKFGPKPKTFSVGIGAAPAAKSSGHKLTASTTASALTVTRGQACTNPDGSATLMLNYFGASGSVLAVRTLQFPANRNLPIIDQYNNSIFTTVPTAAGSNIDTFGANLDTEINTAATGGKLNLAWLPPASTKHVQARRDKVHYRVTGSEWVSFPTAGRTRYLIAHDDKHTSFQIDGTERAWLDSKNICHGECSNPEVRKMLDAELSKVAVVPLYGSADGTPFGVLRWSEYQLGTDALRFPAGTCAAMKTAFDLAGLHPFHYCYDTTALTPTEM